ncbi:MAG: flagellar basal body-associated FliL family protein [Sphingobacteriia bacterium]|nr:flagellar basal body-associated FliL family protein [Sphingobacteriia bacterium]
MAEEEDTQDNTQADELEKIASGESDTKQDDKTASSLRKKRIIIVVAISLLIIIAGAGGFFYLSKTKSNHKEKLDNASQAVKTTLYIDLEDFIVNLNSSTSQPRFLKLSASIEVGSEIDKNQVIANMPKIRDSFQVYLRELRPDDLRGSQSLFRLREELLYRINKTIYPTVVKDILFNEIIVQ